MALNYGTVVDPAAGYFTVNRSRLLGKLLAGAGKKSAEFVNMSPYEYQDFHVQKNCKMVSVAPWGNISDDTKATLSSYMRRLNGVNRMNHKILTLALLIHYYLTNVASTVNVSEFFSADGRYRQSSINVLSVLGIIKAAEHSNGALTDTYRYYRFIQSSL